MNETDREHFVAEAKFMRAFHYFNLVRMFGDVPLILEPVDAGSELLYPERTDKAEVYATIVTDLQEAEAADLPGTNTRGRVTSTAVKTMLADVYLTMAGYPLQAGDEYYEMAAEKAKEIIDKFESQDPKHSWYRSVNNNPLKSKCENRQNLSRSDFFFNLQKKINFSVIGIN